MTQQPKSPLPGLSLVIQLKPKPALPQSRASRRPSPTVNSLYLIRRCMG